MDRAIRTAAAAAAHHNAHGKFARAVRIVMASERAERMQDWCHPDEVDAADQYLPEHDYCGELEEAAHLPMVPSHGSPKLGDGSETNSGDVQLDVPDASEVARGGVQAAVDSAPAMAECVQSAAAKHASDASANEEKEELIAKIAELEMTIQSLTEATEKLKAERAISREDGAQNANADPSNMTDEHVQELVGGNSDDIDEMERQPSGQQQVAPAAPPQHRQPTQQEDSGGGPSNAINATLAAGLWQHDEEPDDPLDLYLALCRSDNVPPNPEVIATLSDADPATSTSGDWHHSGWQSTWRHRGWRRWH